MVNKTVKQLTISSGSYDIEDAQARSNISTLQSDLATINEKIIDNTNDINLISKYILGLKPEETNYRYLIVSKVENMPFNTINSAIDYAINTLNVSLNNPVVILIMTGVYNEQIVLNDVHGLEFIGLNKNLVEIQYNGNYPDCVVHVQGDYYFRNLTFRNTNKDTYIVHQDPSDSNVEGTVVFEDCVFDGGSNGIGYGSGANTTLKVVNSEFKNQGTYHIYGHNSPYARNNQKMILIGNIFHGQKCLMIDDAGASYGNTSTSKMDLYFKNNLCLFFSLGSLLFRPNTNDESQNKPYITGSNLFQGLGCSGNDNIPSMNCNFNNGVSGILDYNVFVYIPKAGADNYSHVTIPVPVYAPAYNVNIKSLTLPGIGNFNGDVGLDSKGNGFINLLFNNNASIIDKVCILNFTVEIGG